MVVNKWVADDGELFDTEEDALAWESILETKFILGELIRQAAPKSIDIKTSEQIASIIMKDDRVLVARIGVEDVRVLPREQGGTA